MKSLRSVLSIALLYAAAGIAQPQTAAAAAENAMKSVTTGKFTFSYRIEGANLAAKLSCPSSGWVSVGFNPKKVMKGAFFILGAVVDGKPVVSEEFGTGMFSHKTVTALGGKNVLIASDCAVENGVVTLSFTMPLSVKDGLHANLAAGKKVKLLFADGGSGDLTKKHKTRGSITITL